MLFQNVSVPMGRLPRHQVCLDLLGHVHNLFYMLLLRKCVPSACVAISVVIFYLKIVLVLNNSDFHMSHEAHCCQFLSTDKFKHL